MTVLYKVEEPTPDRLQQALDIFHDQPAVVRGLLVAAAPVAIVAGVTIAAEAAVVAGVAALGLALFGSVTLADSSNGVLIRHIPKTETDKWQDQESRAIEAGIIYALHPKQPHTLISAPSLQNQILKEQQSDLIDYIRSVVPAKRLIISQSYEGEATSQADAGVFAMFKTARVGRGAVICDLEFAAPEIVPQSRTLRWMDQFPTVVAGLSRATKGEATFCEYLHKNADVSAQIAKQYGFDSRVASSYELCIQVKF